MRDVDSILTSVFGLEQFRPRQREIVEDLISGRDVIAVMPTGAGKSLCFQLPAVYLRGLTLIVSPLISLMNDQVRQLRALRIPALMLNSGQSWDQQREVYARVRDGFKGLLYVAPERFGGAGFHSIITERKLSLLAIDEAHCISHWGHDFRPEYLRLGEIRKQLGNPLTVALTATATPQVREDILKVLGMRSPAVHVTGFDRTNLSYQAISFEKNRHKQDELLDYLAHNKTGGIIYCSTRKNVDEVTEIVTARLRGRCVIAYHAGMDGEARHSSQARFIEREDAVVVATNAFGMGINKPNIRWVIHYNLPGSLEAYYQEAGRAGRDGLPAECILYHSKADVITQQFFIDNIGDNNSKLTRADISTLQKRAKNQLNAMLQYARWECCRRRQILEYFGDPAVPENCDCDVCRAKTPKLRTPNTHAAVAAASASKSRQTVLTYATEKIDLAPADQRIARLKDLRRDAVRSLGVEYFQHLPNDFLQDILDANPQSLSDLRNRLDLDTRLLDNFGERILAIVRGASVASSTVIVAPRQDPPARKEERTSAVKVKAAKEIAGGKVGTLHGPAVEKRFERLRTLRLELARKSGWKPFMVLHDATLLEIARLRPNSLKELLDVKGVGPKKAEQYGAALLAELAKD